MYIHISFLYLRRRETEVNHEATRYTKDMVGPAWIYRDYMQAVADCGRIWKPCMHIHLLHGATLVLNTQVCDGKCFGRGCCWGGTHSTEGAAPPPGSWVRERVREDIRSTSRRGCSSSTPKLNK